MESLSPESRALYDLLKTESAEVYESKFIAYKKEILDAVWASLDDTNNQIKDLSDTVATAQYQMGADLEATHHQFGSELAAVKGSLSAEIAALSSNMDRAIRSSPSTLAGRAPTPLAWQSGMELSAKGTTMIRYTGGRPVHRTSLLRSEVCTPARSHLSVRFPVLDLSILMSLHRPRASNCHNSMEGIPNCGNGDARSISTNGELQRPCGFLIRCRCLLELLRPGWRRF
jgi:hypothetical protein